MSAKPWTTEQVVTKLDALGSRWPSHLELFSWSGSLVLVDHSKDPRDPFDSIFSASEVPIRRGERIKNGGGDPDQINNGDWPDPEES